MDAEERREYARQYRERNREMLRAKARAYYAAHPKPRKARPSLEERFWSKVMRGADGECWEWQGGRDHGYGSIGRGKGSVRANRLSWELHNGPIPDGKHVLHTCDNRSCCNPAHLYIGTDVENARDRVERGRAKGPSGPIVRAPGWNRKVRDDDRRGGIRKFTDEREQEIAARYRAGGVSKSALAREYGVSQPTITAIVNRATA
jgi:hypothetical protein